MEIWELRELKGVETRIEMLMDNTQGRSQKNVLTKKRELGLENMMSYVLHFASYNNRIFKQNGKFAKHW
jgi:hypothetical protein